MKTEEALGEFLLAEGVVKENDASNDLYSGYWFYINIRGVKVPFFPRIGFQNGLPAHDAHHMLLGYETNWIGECETAAWELASGGCGRYIAYWIDRLFFVAIALIMAPSRTLRAWRRGWGQNNLYRIAPDKLLVMDLVEVRRYLSL